MTAGQIAGTNSCLWYYECSWDGVIDFDFDSDFDFDWPPITVLGFSNPKDWPPLVFIHAEFRETK